MAYCCLILSLVARGEAFLSVEQHCVNIVLFCVLVFKYNDNIVAMVIITVFGWGKRGGRWKVGGYWCSFL